MTLSWRVASLIVLAVLFHPLILPRPLRKLEGERTQLIYLILAAATVAMIIGVLRSYYGH